jgi:proteasome lid subunit RPN8/RPN11
VVPPLQPPAEVVLARAIVDAMIRHARAELPRECCGLLVAESGRVVEAVPARNVDESPTRYRVDPRDHFALIRRLRGTGRDILGAYHSHPNGPARPSASDVAEAFDAAFVYVIVSLAEPERPVLGAYLFRDERAEALRLSVEA